METKYTTNEQGAPVQTVFGNPTELCAMAEIAESHGIYSESGNDETGRAYVKLHGLSEDAYDAIRDEARAYADELIAQEQQEMMLNEYHDEFSGHRERYA